MGLVFGLLASLCIGGSDLFGRRVVGARGPVVAGVSIQFVAIFTALAATLIVPSVFSWDDALIGLFSGLGLGLGLLWYFTGLTHSSSAVVAPLVATLSAVIPFLYAVARGASPTLVAVVGAVVALVGLGFITVGGGLSDHIAAGVRWGLASGLAYGFGLSLVVEASDASGSWPAMTQRVSAFALMMFVAVSSRRDPIPPRDLRVPAIVSGVFAGLSTVFFLLGLEVDPTAAIVAGSLFPVVTVVVGRFVYGDDVVARQVGGIGLVVLGVIGVALG
ncbi:MAG: EamA family transporter [Ilumatobacteraceae bacterium]